MLLTTTLALNVATYNTSGKTKSAKGDRGDVMCTMRTKSTKRRTTGRGKFRCGSISSRTSTLVRITSNASSTTVVSLLVTNTVVNRNADCPGLGRASRLAARRCNIKYQGKSSLTSCVGRIFTSSCGSKDVRGVTRACNIRRTLMRRGSTAFRRSRGSDSISCVGKEKGLIINIASFRPVSCGSGSKG